ncbi:MAG: DUF5320 domain-containing protein [Spirochaetales bacterium]|nr:DUF5320 domain-containing protein [Spirochaetales bacterium]
MPRGDGTGPNGLGPMTGRAAGFCAGYSVPGFANPIIGYGRFGGGHGRGYRHMFWATGLPGWARYNTGGYHPNMPYVSTTWTAKQEAEALKDQVKLIQDNLNAINDRIRELEKLEAEKKKPKKKDK